MKLLWGFLFSGVLFGQSCGELFFQKLQFQKNSLSPLKTLTLVNKQTGRTWGSIEYTQEGMAWKIKHLEIDELLRRRGMGSVLLQTFIKEVATQALQQQYTKAYIEFFQTPDEKEFLNFLSFNHIRHILAKDEPAQWFLILDEDKLKEYSLKNIPIISQAYNQNYGLDYSLVKKIELPRRKLIEQLHRLEYYRSETINWDGDDFQQILDDDLIKKLYAISGEDLIGFALYSIIGNEIDVINFGVDLQYTRNELRATYLPLIDGMKELLQKESKIRLKILMPKDHVKTIDLLASQGFKRKAIHMGAFKNPDSDGVELVYPY
jgi:hypothetical protein